MPDVTALTHDDHDLEVIAARADGRASEDRLDDAGVLIAACAACAALEADLRAIAMAMPELPVRPRTRDYRLTPHQAAELAPSGWRRMLGAFASPKLSFAAPLGTGLAALGIAGLLVTSAPMQVLTGASTPAAGSQERMETRSTGASADPSVDNAAPAPSAGMSVATTDLPPDVQAQPPERRDELVAKRAGAGVEAPLPVIFGGLFAVGVALLALRVVSRRFARPS